MNTDAEKSDTELLHDAMACSVRQRSLLSLVERRCAQRELNAQCQREKRAKKGAPTVMSAPDDRPAA
jgi:hypothetical protein